MIIEDLCLIRFWEFLSTSWQILVLLQNDSFDRFVYFPPALPANLLWTCIAHEFTRNLKSPRVKDQLKTSPVKREAMTFPYPAIRKTALLSSLLSRKKIFILTDVRGLIIIYSEVCDKIPIAEELWFFPWIQGFGRSKSCLGLKFINPAIRISLTKFPFPNLRRGTRGGLVLTGKAAVLKTAGFCPWGFESLILRQVI